MMLTMCAMALVSFQPAGVQKGIMEWSDDGRDGIVDVDRNLPFEECDASPLELLQDATRFYNGVV